MAFRAMLAATCFPLALSLSMGDYARLNAGEALVELLPAESKEVAVRAVTRFDADPGHLIHWTRRVDELQKGRYLDAIGRFSDPPQLSDLEALSLDDDDLTDLRRCRLGKCGVKRRLRRCARRSRQPALAGSPRPSRRFAPSFSLGPCSTWPRDTEGRPRITMRGSRCCSTASSPRSLLRLRSRTLDYFR